MTKQTQAALAKMQAANAALTPEQRKERSRKAAATAKANREAAKAASTTPGQARGVQPDAPKPEAMADRNWRVTLVIEHEDKRALWSTNLPSPGMKRASAAAREHFRSSGLPGLPVAVASVVDTDLVSLPLISR